MNKKVFGRKLSRSRPAREALFATLTRAMILNGKITTTKAKAKAVQGSLEKYVTLAKKGTLSARHQVLADLDNSRESVEDLFKKIAPVFSGKTSGFTRLVTLPRRLGDNAEMARIEWTEKIEVEDKSKKDKGDESKTEITKEKKNKVVKKSEKTHH